MMRKLEHADQRVVLELELDLSEDCCAWPLCCPGKQPQIIRPECYPPESLGLVDKIEEMRQEINEVFDSSGFPPCLFFLACIPCPVVHSASYGLQRSARIGRERLQKVVEIADKFNIFACPLGFFARLNKDFTSWRLEPNYTGCFGSPKLEVMMHIPTRQAYCRKLGIPFDDKQDA